MLSTSNNTQQGQNHTDNTQQGPDHSQRPRWAVRISQALGAGVVIVVALFALVTSGFGQSTTLAPIVAAFLASNLDWTWQLAGLGAIWAAAGGAISAAAERLARIATWSVRRMVSSTSRASTTPAS